MVRCSKQDATARFAAMHQLAAPACTPSRPQCPAATALLQVDIGQVIEALNNLPVPTDWVDPVTQVWARVRQLVKRTFGLVGWLYGSPHKCALDGSMHVNAVLPSLSFYVVPRPAHCVPWRPCLAGLCPQIWPSHISTPYMEQRRRVTSGSLATKQNGAPGSSEAGPQAPAAPGPNTPRPGGNRPQAHSDLGAFDYLKRQHQAFFELYGYE